MDLPEFSAYELNELEKRSRKNEYYTKAYLFILSIQDLSPVKEANLSEKQIKWAWGIKSDLKDE